MPRASDGTYTLPATSVSPAINATVIDPNDFNDVMDDLASAMTDSLARDAKGAMTGILTTASGRIVATRVITATGAITAATTDHVIVIKKTVGAASAVALFATPTLGTVLVIKDGKGDAAANNITVTPAAGTIDGASTVVISTNYGRVTLLYNGTEWGRID